MFLLSRGFLFLLIVVFINFSKKVALIVLGLFKIEIVLLFDFLTIL